MGHLDNPFGSKILFYLSFSFNLDPKPNFPERGQLPQLLHRREVHILSAHCPHS